MSTESFEDASAPQQPEMVGLDPDAINELVKMAADCKGKLPEAQVRKAAGLAIDLLGQAITIDQSELPFINGHDGVLNKIIGSANEINRHRTGQALPYIPDNGSPYDRAVAQLTAAWNVLDQPRMGEPGYVSELAGDIMGDALQGLDVISHARPASVHPQTYAEFRYALGGQA